MATVTYFFGRGLAEHIRFLLAAVGEPFTNRCLSTAEELDELRARGDLAFNQLPLTELDGLKMVQVRRHYTPPPPDGARGAANPSGAGPRSGKARAAIEALKSHDFVYLHLEAIDEVSHEQDLRKKIQASCMLSTITLPLPIADGLWTTLCVLWSVSKTVVPVPQT